MEKKPLAIIVLILIASLAVCGCVTSTTNNTQSGTTTFSSSSGYKITFPRGWMWEENTNASAPIQAYLYLNRNNTTGDVDVFTQKLNATTGSTPQDLQDFFVNDTAYLSSYQNYRLLATAPTTLAGQPAHKIVWQATVPQDIGLSAKVSQLAPLKVMEIYAVHNGTGYVITYKATPSDYDTCLSLAEQYVDIKIKS